MRHDLIAAIGLAIVVTASLGCGSEQTPGPSEPTPVANPSAEVVRIDVGLTPEQAAVWHHHDEGSGFIPLSFFKALEDAETGEPFFDVMPRFGLVPDPGSDQGLPIGLTAAKVTTAPNEMLHVGVNCGACHSGLYTYQGTSMVIDGAPNMLNFKSLLDGLNASVKATLASPTKLYQTVTTMIDLENQAAAAPGDDPGTHPQAADLAGQIARAPDGHPLVSARQHLETALDDAYHAANPDERDAHLADAADRLEVDDEHHEAGEGAVEHFKHALKDLGDDLDYLKRHAERLHKLADAFEGRTDSGPGRADSFDAIWDLLVQHDQVMAMNAPVSIPHLFEYDTFEWVHWDGNSSTVMGRDYAQAIALGGELIEDTLETSILPRNVIELELTAHALKAPAWPVDVLGPIDAAKVEVGRALFDQQCARCHSGETLVPVDEIGTDPLRVENFAKLEQDGKSYKDLLIELGDAVTAKSLRDHEVTDEEVAQVERSPDPTWRVTNAYHTRALAGVWATPPYLHNGSVPTVWDLLQPASERPTTFLVGRELDPVKLGIDAENQPASDWRLDTSLTGNANTGHEYGTELIDDEKWALIEYLKTL